MIYRGRDGTEYTAGDLLEVLRIVDGEEAAALYKEHFDRRLLAIRAPTGVRKTHILYSSGIPTISCLDAQGPGPVIITSDGDDTAEVESLLLPLSWWDSRDHHAKGFNGSSHLCMLYNPEVIEYIMGLVG